LVAFLGPVGVGKSTVMRYLAEVLKIKGQRVLVGVLKSFHGISYALWFFIARILGLRSRGRYAPWLLLIKGRKIEVAKLLLNLAMYFDAFLFIPTKLLLLRSLKRLGFVILVEEYAYTSILDYLYTGKQMLNMKSLPRTPLNIVLSLLARYEPDALIILTADTRELIRRWRKRGYGEPQQQYLKLLTHYCMNIVRCARKIIIDTTDLNESQTLEFVYKSIIEVIERRETKRGQK
jgi:broad-specificity NMP kinase